MNRRVDVAGSAPLMVLWIANSIRAERTSFGDSTNFSGGGAVSDDTAEFLRAASRVTGISSESLGVDPDERDPDIRAIQLRQADALAAALWHASNRVLDGLFDDLGDLMAMPQGTGPSEDGEILFLFPPRFRSRYDAHFVRKLIVAASDLFARLTREWTPPSCVAQELLTRALFFEVEVYEDVYDLDLADDWRSDFEQDLLEDLDHEFLFDPAADGFEDDPEFGPPGMVSMSFDSWFAPFGGHRLPPFIEAPDVDG